MERSASLYLIILALACSTTFAQTSAFTYQGKLTVGGSSASVPHDFIFRLFSLPAGGTQVGLDVIRDDVTLTAGIFTVVCALSPELAICKPKE